MRENLDAVQVRFDLGGDTLLCRPSIPLDERRVEGGVKPSDQAVLNEGRERVARYEGEDCEVVDAKMLECGVSLVGQGAPSTVSDMLVEACKQRADSGANVREMEYVRGNEVYPLVAISEKSCGAVIAYEGQYERFVRLQKGRLQVMHKSEEQGQ